MLVGPRLLLPRCWAGPHLRCTRNGAAQRIVARLFMRRALNCVSVMISVSLFWLDLGVGHSLPGARPLAAELRQRVEHAGLVLLRLRAVLAAMTLQLHAKF